MNTGLRTIRLILLYLAVGVSLLAALTARDRLMDANREIALLRNQQSDLILHRNTLLQQMNTIELSSPFLSATEVIGPGAGGLPILGQEDVVLYLFSTRCPYSSSNLEFLRRASNAGIEVIGLATDSIAADVRRYWDEFAPGFPALFEPNGSAMGLVPQFSTPTLAVVSGGQLVSLSFGELRQEAQETVLAWFSIETDPM